jgi:hypothetical protein
MEAHQRPFRGVLEGPDPARCRPKPSVRAATIKTSRAEGFRRMVEAGGHEWPDGWVKGRGFVRPRQDADPMQPPQTVSAVGEEYVRQIVDLSPGQRKRHLDQVRILATVEVPSPRGAYRRSTSPSPASTKPT